MVALYSDIQTIQTTINYIKWKYYVIGTIKKLFTRWTYSRQVEIYPLLSTTDAISMFNAMAARIIAKQTVEPFICICGLKSLYSELIEERDCDGKK